MEKPTTTVQDDKGQSLGTPLAPLPILEPHANGSESDPPNHSNMPSPTPTRSAPSDGQPDSPPRAAAPPFSSAPETAPKPDSMDFAASPANPRNWSDSKKWRITLTVALTGFISTCGSSIGVPGIHAAMDEYGETNLKIGVMITTAYVLGLGAGPFIFAPISELYGRQTSYLISLTCYIVFCIGTAVSNSLATLIVLRFFCGVFGSSGPSLGVATCADVWPPHQRGRPISIYAIGPMAGPVLGNAVGYWIVLGGWRWLFWTITFLSAANLVLFVTLTQETYGPVIEKRLVYALRHPDTLASSRLAALSPRRVVRNLGWMRAMVGRSEARQVFGNAFSRPPRLLFTNPVCFMFSAYYAYIYGIIYIFLVSIPLMFGSPPLSHPSLFSYRWPDTTVSLAYVGIAVGIGMAVTTGATQQDRIYKYLSRRHGGSGQPEYRLVLTQSGMIIMPLGLFIFAWTAQAQTHWIGPQIGMAVVMLGLTMAFNSIQNFLVDAFFPYSAAAVASATALRSIVACILPEFSGDLFTNLGWGWGGTLIALVALVAVPAPAIMFVMGKRLRERFKFQG